MTDDLEIRRRHLESEIEWNRRNIDSLTRDRKKAPFVLLLLLLAIPAGIWIGLWAVPLVIVATCFVLGALFYITYGHRQEYQEKIQDLERELRELPRVNRPR